MATPSAPYALGTSPPSEQPLELAQVVQALDAIYDPRSSNETRQAASSFLEDAKRHPQAPQYGVALASDRANPPTLRHYGLSMLEYCIKYTWPSYSQEQRTSLQENVVRLVFDANEADQLHLRNKMAQLWVETAKRAWAIEWLNMDELLVKLWQTSGLHQRIVLSILETLSDETFVREDPAIGLRGNDLGQACVEIFNPASVLTELHPDRETSKSLRCGSEGWLYRVSALLGQSTKPGAAQDEQSMDVAIRCLGTLKAAFGWVMFRSIAAVDCAKSLVGAATNGDLAVRTATVEAWVVTYSRAFSRDEDFLDVVPQMFRPEVVRLLSDLHQYSLVDVEDIDDSKYVLDKKLSELLHALGSLLDLKLHLAAASFDMHAFFSLLFDMVRNSSLIISIPVLHLWTRLLRSRLLQETPFIMNSIGGLLEVCSQRLVRYENFPEDSADASYRFLVEDIDTIPERHAFLGNYRRYCIDIIEVIVRKLPVDAVTHILDQAVGLFEEVAREQVTFQPENFTKTSPSVLRVDAQITVIEAAIKGYLKWLSGPGDDAQRNEQDRSALLSKFEQCGSHIMGLNLRDPEIQRKVIQLLVTFATKPLYDKSSFALNLLEMLLQPAATEIHNLHPYNEAVKSLQSIRFQELSRLAMAFPDQFLPMWGDVEHKMFQMFEHHSADEKQEMGYQAFLFIIAHRAANIDQTSREARLQNMLAPVRSAWQDPALTSSLESFDSFCHLLGLSRLVDFVTSRDFHKVRDWTSQQLDEQGIALQADILSSCHRLPLRMTKSLLAAATEKVEEGTPQWEMSRELWAEIMPLMLPNLLQLIRWAQTFNNTQSWSSLPEELQRVISRIQTDRFWQAGISTESRDDFFARVSNSKSSFEGFASTVRGAVRQIRETGYWIIYGLIRFKDLFYGIPDLAVPLSQALYANSTALSAHHFSVLLNMSVQLIEGCPPRFRKQFLPPILSELFAQLDRKISSEWDAIRARIDMGGGDPDSLGDEMKSESILRQLTHTAVSLAFSLLSYHRPESLDARPDGSHGASSTSTENPSAPRMHTFILSTDVVLGQFLVFLRNALRFRDARSVTLAVRTLRSVIPRLPLHDPQQGPGVRHFLSEELLKSAITSLNEPYYIDVQKDLAGLIAQILAVEPASGVDGDLARDVLLSLPGLGNRPEKVNSILSRLRRQSSEHGGQMGDRQTRALVLDLLKEVRSQSIQEIGRILPARGSEPSSKAKKERSKLQEQYMSVDESASAGGIGRGGEDALDGVANMFA